MAASLPTASAGNPFLLPVCSCGGPMNLASLEPHPTPDGSGAQDLQMPALRQAAGVHRAEAGEEGRRLSALRMARFNP